MQGERISPFDSFQDAVDYWMNNVGTGKPQSYGDMIKGAKTIEDFVNVLQPYYNTKKGDWKDLIINRYKNLPEWEERCGVKP